MHIPLFGNGIMLIMLPWTSRWSRVARRARSTRPTGRSLLSAKTDGTTTPPTPTWSSRAWKAWTSNASWPHRWAAHMRQNFPPRLPHPPYSRPFRFCIYLASLAFGGHAFVGYVYSYHATYGISMLPTIPSFGAWVVVSKWYRRGRGVQVGDLVSFKHPSILGTNAIKRVIGMQGDFVLMNTPNKSEAMIQIPQGHCWVVGDNMEHSRDSRLFGPLPLALIAGKVTAKFEWEGWTPQFSRFECGLEPASIDAVQDVD